MPRDNMQVVSDHRIPGMVTYPLDEVLLVTLVGVVCGAADDWDGVEEVAMGALDWLRGFLPFSTAFRRRRPCARCSASWTRRLCSAASPPGPPRCTPRRGSDRRGRQDVARVEDVARREGNWPSARAWPRPRWRSRASWASSCIACWSTGRSSPTREFPVEVSI